MNPVSWLELRIRTRETRLWLIALFFVGTLFLVGAVVLANLRTGIFEEPATIGTALGWGTLFSQAALLIILSPLANAGRISQEREQRTMPALLNSPQSAVRIAWGKLFGAWCFVFWFASLTLPFLSMAALWGGLPLKITILAFIFNLAAGLTLTSLALGISGLFGRSLTSYLVTGAVLFGWLAVLPILGTLCISLRSVNSKTYETLIAYLTFYHNPFCPIVMMSSTIVNPTTPLTSDSIQILAYAMAVWILIAALGFWLAVRGLKRELY